ncbi:YwiC-like family protein [cf. Phormidesmis sp. LEGE 11477]|uniref:YwiC-like family protein n=1 Tax=cf. Phormidesmis sp. LEGE 11477 TaxID=1828680 RepID=UPI00187F6672|nr:YwiC-like family protein [cf. Phormidesmis sp. LEGE 11477]MBE9060823.1 YwiC-like family protein [cf. Phormidesmis sp. LEGE 11477]
MVTAQVSLKTLSTVSALPLDNSPSKKRWYQPTFSPEHGVLLVLLGAVLTGASLAQAWTGDTSLACLAGFLGLQSEHPLVVQIKRRRQWRPRYLFWAGLYGGSALALALYLSFQHPILFWICGAAVLALAIDVLSVVRRNQKAVVNEIVMFSAICLSTLFVFGATTGTITPQAVGLWILNSLFFSGAVFSVKLRKVKTSSLQAGFIYHGCAIALVIGLYALGWLSSLTALVFAIALIKIAIVTYWRNWYRTCRFEHIARFETYFALIYTALVSLTVLPPKLPPVA